MDVLGPPGSVLAYRGGSQAGTPHLLGLNALYMDRGYHGEMRAWSKYNNDGPTLLHMPRKIIKGCPKCQGWEPLTYGGLRTPIKTTFHGSCSGNVRGLGSLAHRDQLIVSKLSHCMYTLTHSLYRSIHLWRVTLGAVPFPVTGCSILGGSWGISSLAGGSKYY